MFRKLKIRKQKKKLAKLLNGRKLEDVLAEAPYGYGYFQGEEGYRIWDERVENGFVAFAVTTLNAEIWIVEKYLSEESELGSRKRNYRR